MNTTTIARPQPSPLDRIFALHTPTWRTVPPRCLACAQPIGTLEEWLAGACAGAPQREGAAA